ncbi:MAG: GAF domain-containing protein [Chloroflexi bacterium]|nr:GAF domain-containing protein [Chloroflexota bacterium]
MRRLAPVIILAFVAFALVGSYLYQDNIRSHLTQVHIAGLADYANQISSPLEEAIMATQRLAQGAAARVFASELERTGGPTGSELLNGQPEMLETMYTVLNASNGAYFAVRYVDLEGTVWSQITYRNGLLSRSTQQQIGVLANDTPFQAALKTLSLSLSAVTMRQISPGVVEPAIRIFAPVNRADTGSGSAALGFIELEVLVKPIVTPVNLADEGDGQRWVLVNNIGRYLADSSAPRAYLNSLMPSSSGTLERSEPQLAALLAGSEGDIQLAETTDGLISAQRINIGSAPDMPWTLLVIDYSGYSLGSIIQGIGLIVAVSVLGSVVSLTIISRILRRRLAPLTVVNTMVTEMAAGRLDDTLRIGDADEMGHLLDALRGVSARLRDLTIENDERSQRRARSLQIAERISQETAALVALTSMDNLVNRIIELICSEYGFYHAQVFLLDDIGLNAVLVYSRGLIGQRLLEQKLVIPVGHPSVVGMVAHTGTAVIVNDLNARHTESPIYERLLPDTKAQMALPLMIGNRIIGVLDIHSIVVKGFPEDEVPIFQLLANQIATAVHDGRLLMQSNERIRQMDALNRQLTRRAWSEVQEQARLQPAYRYDLIDVVPTEAETTPPPQSISAPISIRGQVIGSIDAAAPPDHPFTMGDQMVLRAVAERVGMVIEGARLFSETQNALAVTELLYNLSRYLNQADTLEDIIQAIITSTMSDATGGQVWLLDESPHGDMPDWIEIVADWSSMERAGQSRAHLRLPLVESAFLSGLRDSRVKLVQDVALDQRLDSDLRQMFLAWGTRAAVFIPFNVRGTWRGLITIEFARPRDFSEREGRIYSALTDQAGVAVDNRLLFSQTETTLDRIERMYAASRIINSAQSPTDLVRAAAAATKDPALGFELGILEGQLDDTGWPTRIRKVATWDMVQAVEEDRYETLHIPDASPLRHREPEVIGDQDSGRLTAIFPMFSANQPIALLYLHSAMTHELTDDDYEVYNALSGQMSTMLENRRLLTQTAQALDETRRLYEASRAITGAPDLKAVYQAAAAHLSAGEEPVSRIQILLAGPNPGLDAAYYDTVHVWEDHPDPASAVRAGLRLTNEAAPVRELLAEYDDVIYFADLDTDLAGRPRLRQVLQRGGTASVMLVPLRTQRSYFGVVLCECESLHGFDDSYKRFARAVADQIAIAVENRLLFDEARQEAQRALALAEAGQLATRIGTDFEADLNEVFARVAEPAGYDRWLVMLLDESAPNQLEAVVWHTPGQTTVSGVRFDLTRDQNAVVDAVRLGRALVVNTPASYPTFSAGGDLLHDIGKYIALPVFSGDRIVGSLAAGRPLDGAALDKRDEQLLSTLAAQVGIAVENRRLFRQAESERQYLGSILESMPTGILVLDGQTFKPIQANAQAQRLLGVPLDFDQPFTAAAYNLYRTGSSVHYPADELPIYVAATSGGQYFSDDLVIVRDDGTRTDLLLNAAPIIDERGGVTTIVAAFQDISNLRGLENALQDNLRETIALYEVSRSLAEADDMEAVMDIVTMQMMLLEPTDGYIILRDQKTGSLTPARALSSPDTFDLPQGVFDTEQLIVPDTTRDSRFVNVELSEMLVERGILALASIPMRVRDNLLGWIIVTYDQPHEFTAENERFLNTLGDGAAVTIDNRSLFMQTERAYQEAATLYLTTRALATATNPDDVVRAVVEQTNRRHLTQVFLAVPPPYDQNQTPVVMEVASFWQREDASALNLRGIMLAEDQFPAWRLMVSPSIVLLDDLTEATLTEVELIGLESLDVRSLAALPLRVGSRLIGTLWLASNQPYSHTEEDWRLYQALAEQASLSIHAAQLLTQAERRANQLSTSAEISRIASSILDLNLLLPQLVDLIKAAFHYDHVQIFLMDEAGVNAELRASTGQAGQQLLAIRHKLPKGSASVIGSVTSTGQPSLALDTADARFVHKPNPYLPLTRSEMALPLVIKGRVVGALDVQSNQPNAFTREDVDVLSALAGQISIAIDNATLFAQSERRARDMGFLFTVTSAAALPDQSLSSSLQNVAELVLSELNSLTVTIYMTERFIDEDGEPLDIVRPVALAGSDQPLTEIMEVRAGDHSNLVGVVARTLEPAIINNVQQEHRYAPIAATAASAIVVPMTAGSQIIGLIAIEDARPGSFNQETLTLLRTLNTTLSAIVQNAQLLEQVRKQNEQLRELDKLKNDFLANMSHELRTPLNSIIGFSRVILKGIDGPLTEMQEQDLTTIYTSGQHLLGLINDILDQAKISAGKMDLQKDYFDVKPVLEGVRSIGIGLVKDKPIEIRLNIASGLPKAYGDEFRTRQVLLNLVSNAAKFTQQGSIIIQAYLDNDPETGKEMMRVDVEDTGIGIAEKDLPLLFEAFQQIDSSLTRTVGGTGLGLPISKSLVEMQGGRMLVMSEINVGSTFSILIPLEPTDPTPENDPTAAAKTKKQTDKLSGNGKTEPKKTGPLPPTLETIETNRDKRATNTVIQVKRQILLVEDNPDMINQYRRALQREGFDIFAASIPLEAEAMASGLRPTLIIMDVDFAGGAGWDILHRLHEREDTQDIPIIVCTLNGDEERARLAGAFAFIRRPFTPEQLVRAVREAERDSQTERILIIDDQAESLRLIQDALNQYGRYRIFTAGGGAEGISMVARCRPDLVILDLRMPEKDGFAVLNELQANPETAAIPILIVTADTLSAKEKDRLADVTVLYKSDLSYENYIQLIAGVKAFLSRQNGE